MERSRLALMIRNEQLARVLLRSLSHLFAVPAAAAEDSAGPTQPTVLVTTTTDCPTSLCQEFVRRGHHVVVLAAVPHADQELAYLKSGAAGYLPMDANADKLHQFLRSLSFAADA